MNRINHRRSAAASPFRVPICAAILALAGCAQPSAPAAPTAMAPPADPVLRAVAAAAVNVPVNVATPAGTQASLVVTSDYISAEGQECRAYTLSSGAGLACTDGTTWREIPPLAPAANTGPTQ